MKRTSWVLNQNKQATEEPSKANLEDYLKGLDSSVMTDPATQRFLDLHFQIPPLQVTIWALTRGNERVEKHLSQMLADIYQSGFDAETMIAQLQDSVERRIDRRKVDLRNKNFGKIIEKAVMKAFEMLELEKRMIRVQPNWESYDFAAYLEEKLAESPDVGHESILITSLSGKEIARFEVEVKATTADSVRMTSAEGEESANRTERYLLCVVDARESDTDLKELANHELTDEEVQVLSERIRPLMHLSYIGERLAAPVHRLNETKEDARPISMILKPTYIVPETIWKDQGMNLEAWTASLPKLLVAD